jgi:hypothetical protein
MLHPVLFSLDSPFTRDTLPRRKRGLPPCGQSEARAAGDLSDTITTTKEEKSYATTNRSVCRNLYPVSVLRGARWSSCFGPLEPWTVRAGERP